MELDKACRKLAKELNEEYDLIRDIVLFEWKFAKQTMQDPSDTRDILFNKLFKFKLKPRFKLNKTKEYSPNENITGNKK